MVKIIKENHIFAPALIVSAVIHAGIISGAMMIPVSAQFSVLDAPNSLEVTVISEPQVTIIEEKMVTKEIHPVADDVILIHPQERKLQNQAGHSIASDKPKFKKNLFGSNSSQGAVVEAKPVMQVNLAPQYPHLARKEGWEGTVRLDVHVSREGEPTKIMVSESSGHSILDNTALKTVETWKFLPARSGRLNFSSKITIPIQFSLVKE